METLPGAAKTNSRQPRRVRAVVVVIVILAVLLVGLGVWLRTKPADPASTNTSSVIPFTPPTEMCEPEDVQQCPDGTFIHRELPDCEMPVCPINSE